MIKNLEVTDYDDSEAVTITTVELDIADTKLEEAKRFGIDIDGEDYRNNYWQVFVMCDTNSHKFNCSELYYITSDDLLPSGEYLSEEDIQTAIEFAKEQNK